jgi:hypothetical protein
MHRSNMRIPSPPPYAPARQSSNQAEGWRRMAIVFAGAAIGAFFVWPLIRGAFIPEQSYQEPPEQGYQRPNNHTGMTPYGFPQQTDSRRGDQGRQWRRECIADRWGRVSCGPQQDGDLPPRRGR